MKTAARFRNATPRARFALAALAASAAFTCVNAFAASLGATANGLGADSKVVASCGAGMTFGYTTTFYQGIAGYAVDGIDLSNIPAACLGKTLSVTFYDGGSAPLGSAVAASLPAAGTSDVISVAPGSNTIGAGGISGVSIVVS